MSDWEAELDEIKPNTNTTQNNNDNNDDDWEKELNNEKPKDKKGRFLNYF